MPSPLVVVPFSAALSEFVAGFSCGEEPHERELADWIKKATGVVYSSMIYELRRIGH